jgi:DNA-binding MarR family transcriptional regulator
MYSNPFTPVFGNEPPIIAGREKIMKDVVRGLDNAPGDPNRVTIFTGPRGSGKTVLLSRISAIAEGQGWISVHSFAAEGMLDDLRQQTEERAAEFLPVRNKSKVSGVQVYGTGVTFDNVAESGLNWRTQMGRYIDELNAQDIGLLFTIDEVAPEEPEMVQFISVFQMFIREKRNVALLMAGLPGKVLMLFKNDKTTFLRRAFRRRLGAIGLPEVRTTMKKTIELSGRNIGKAALEKAGEYTEGFPFMIQLIGYYAFNQSNAKTITMNDVEMGYRDAREDMENMILEASLNDLSDKDIEFLTVMLEDGEESRISDIAERMEVSASYASHYKRRLLEQGLITEAGRGKVVFSMPMFKDLFSERYGPAGETEEQ